MQPKTINSLEKELDSYVLSTVCSGIGSPELGAEELAEEGGHKVEIGFHCEIDQWARKSYEANFKSKKFVPDMTKCDWIGDEYYADVLIGGIPCQAFSLAGKRLGELDPRGLLFYDFYRLVDIKRPKAFIIENVKGLLSDSNGKTFQNWLLLLGDSVNGHRKMFEHPDSLGYNLHWTVLNSKDFGVPQNRERVFLVGIRPDIQNDFRFPVGEKLKIRLKDVLEKEVDEKYYLSDKAMEYLSKGASGNYSDRLTYLNKKDANYAGCITANHSKGVPYYMLEVEEPNIKIAHVSRSEEGKELRRQAMKKGKDYTPFQAKQIEFKESDVMNTITCATTKDNLIMETSRIAGWFENENVIGAYQGDAKRSSVSEHIYHKPTGICNTIQTAHAPKIIENQKVYVSDIDDVENRIYSHTCGSCGWIYLGKMSNFCPKCVNGGGSGHTNEVFIEPNFFIDSVIDKVVKKTNVKLQEKGVDTMFKTKPLEEPKIKVIGRLNSSQDGQIFSGDGISQCLSSGHGNTPKVLIEEPTLQFLGSTKENNRGDGTLSRDYSKQNRIYDSEGLAETIPTNKTFMGQYLVEEPTILQTNLSGQIFENNHAGTLRAGASSNYQVVKTNQRIRRLTPLECWRLQAFTDESFYNAKNAGVSDTQLYKQAGNSMTKNVIKAVQRNVLKCIFGTS